jgi:hypothetical protein
LVLMARSSQWSSFKPHSGGCHCHRSCRVAGAAQLAAASGCMHLQQQTWSCPPRVDPLLSLLRTPMRLLRPPTNTTTKPESGSSCGSSRSTQQILCHAVLWLVCCSGPGGCWVSPSLCRAAR